MESKPVVISWCSEGWCFVPIWCYCCAFSPSQRKPPVWQQVCTHRAIWNRWTSQTLASSQKFSGFEMQLTESRSGLKYALKSSKCTQGSFWFWITLDLEFSDWRYSHPIRCLKVIPSPAPCLFWNTSGPVISVLCRAVQPTMPWYLPVSLHRCSQPHRMCSLSPAAVRCFDHSSGMS